MRIIMNSKKYFTLKLSKYQFNIDISYSSFNNRYVYTDFFTTGRDVLQLTNEKQLFDYLRYIILQF